MINALELSGFSLRLADENRPLITLDRIIQPGECLTIMGPSGRGKSTILQAIAGFAPAWAVTTGMIRAGGQRIDLLPPEKRRLGMLFQDDLLFPHLTVGGNLLFGLPSTIKGRQKRREIAEHALADAGLGGFFDRPPQTLSGGQRSRVSLLRALLSAPRALLLDEPFARLDTTTRATMRKTVFDLARRQGLPMLLVTHDLADAEAAGASIIQLPDIPLMDSGES
jgi:putative thiamine transport system ATP-binding protein